MVSEYWHMDLQLFAGEKTEQATPKRRQEARKKGQVPRSHDLTGAIILLTVLLILHSTASQTLHTLWTYLQDTLSHSYGEVTVGRVQEIFWQGALVMLRVIGPVFLGGVVLALLVNMVQTGFLFTLQGIKPDFTRINPFTGAKRIFSARSLFELFKSLGKLTVIALAAYSGIKGSFNSLMSMGEFALNETMVLVGTMIYRVGLRVGLALLVLGVIDYMYQRWEHTKGLRMTKQEVKEEMKQSEGDPLVKSQIKQRQRQIAARRMMHEVPNADVVITNPTHFAIALKYDPASMAAPVILAKGAGYVAQRIKEIATANGITIVENRPLAQALYKACEVGTPVPADLYQAVAEVLAFVYRLKKRRVTV